MLDPNDPYVDENGKLRDITRVEFELIDADKGIYKWNLWSDGVLLESHCGRPAEVDTHLKLTCLLLLPFVPEGLA